MSPAVARAWCCACNRAAGLVALPYAALLSGRTLPEVSEQVERGELHSQNGPDGIRFVCLNSLIQSELWHSKQNTEWSP